MDQLKVQLEQAYVEEFRSHSSENSGKLSWENHSGSMNQGLGHTPGGATEN
ncbi:hypothetical protein Hdeb2414_s0016g00482051 [Helianthus debilis subsp. tardiflorus]